MSAFKIFGCLIRVMLLAFLGIFFLSPECSAGYYDKSYALVVGIDKYLSPDWPDLSYARNDAEAVAAFLRMQGFEVSALYDENATKSAIISKLQNDFARRVHSNDRILFFFAGHGYTEELGGKDWGYIVPYHSQRASSAAYISMEEIRTLAEKMGTAKHQLYIMDSCYGGLLGTRGVGVDENIPNYLEEVTKRPARQIITAGGKDQGVLDKGAGEHSVFTGNLLEALEKGFADLNADGFITFAELSAYLLPRASNAYQTPAAASLPGHGLGEFVFTSPQGGRISPPGAETGAGIQSRGSENAPDTNTGSTFGNSFSDLRVVDSPDALRIKIKYNFFSEHGKIAKAAARPLRNGRYPGQYFSHSTEIIQRGQGELSLSVHFYPKGSTASIATDQLEFVMWNEKHGTFFKVPFELVKTWKSPAD